MCVGSWSGRTLPHATCAHPVLALAATSGEHTDSGSITMVLLDPNCPRGLEVQSDETGADTWLDVCDGHSEIDVRCALVLNCGATLERWTNGRWKAGLHRVMNHPPQRLSIITSALTPRPDVSLDCLPGCEGPGGEVPSPVLAGEFLNARVWLQRTDYRGGEM